MTTEQRYNGTLNWFRQNMPVAETELEYSDPWQLTVAVILSAQCTDKRVNIVTGSLFAKYPDADSMSKAETSEIRELIKSVSYPNSKARHLSGMSQMLVAEFDGQIPDNFENLRKLPGVGRKTANVVLSAAFGKPTMAVDTHVFRVSARIGLTINAKNPLETERQLVARIPESELSIAHHWLILHGRYVCIARKPKCEHCGIKTFCNYYETINY